MECWGTHRSCPGVRTLDIRVRSDSLFFARRVSAWGLHCSCALCSDLSSNALGGTIDAIGNNFTKLKKMYAPAFLSILTGESANDAAMNVYDPCGLLPVAAPSNRTVSSAQSPPQSPYCQW